MEESRVTEELLINEKTGRRLTVYYEQTAERRPMVVIYPGGGYTHLSDREGRPVAMMFLELGLQAAVLEYTVRESDDAEELCYQPALDGGWAVKTLRERAEHFCLDPEKVAVCGFSAGGHAAGSLGVFWNNAALFPTAAERCAVRPDAMILCYPVITGGKYAHRGSFEQLSSDRGRQEQEFSLERRVHPDVPPTFLWHTAADEAVPVQNSLLFAGALAANGVPVELHVFPYGAHGLSLATPEVNELNRNRRADPHVAQWTQLAGRWIREVLKW